MLFRLDQKTQFLRRQSYVSRTSVVLKPQVLRRQSYVSRASVVRQSQAATCLCFVSLFEPLAAAPRQHPAPLMTSPDDT